MLASSTVDCELESRSGQTKDYKTGICCFSAKHAALRRKIKDRLTRNRKMCPSGTTCLTVECCFSEVAVEISNSACWSSTKQRSSSSRWKLTCSRHDQSLTLFDVLCLKLLLTWHYNCNIIFFLYFQSQYKFVCEAVLKVFNGK